MQTNLTQLLPSLLELIYQAGTYAKSKYNAHNKIKTKSDNTPVTEVDLYISDFLTEHLIQLTPNVPVLSEENSDISLLTRKEWQEYWLIDPIDGTKEFIKKTHNFAIVIALIQNNTPVLGLIYIPMLDTYYYAIENQGAYKKTNNIVSKIQTYKNNTNKITLLLGSSNSTKNTLIQQKLNTKFNYSFIKQGSCAIKSCLVAEGLYDGYLCSHPTGEWDIGACDIIIKEAGGIVCDLQSNPLTFNLRETLINPPFILLGDKQKLEIIQNESRS